MAAEPDPEGPRLSRLVAALPATVPFAAAEALERASGHRFELRLGANENALGPSPAALEAAGAALRNAARYCDPDCHELRTRLAQLTGAPVEQILVGSGIDDLLGLAVRCLSDPLGAVVATAGTYPTFAYHVRAYGATLAEVAYGSDMRVDLDALGAAARAHRATVVYVANPDNPGGMYHPQTALDDLSAGLPRDCTLIVDEAYEDFVADGSPVVTGRQPPGSRVVRLKTFSKAHGLAGLRIGYAVAPQAYIRGFEKVRVQYGVNSVAQAAALASLGDPGHVARVVRAVSAERPRLVALGERLGWRAIASWTNFVSFLVGDASDAAAWVSALAREGVFVRRGSAPPFDACVRVTIPTSAERRRLATIIAGMGSRAAGAQPAGLR